jgi:hypothetical protein
MKTITLAVTALLALTLPALAQDFPTPQEIIAQNDKNGDGAIDHAEWAASPAPVPFPEEADTNHDGKIDLAELSALFAQFQAGGPPPPPPQVAPTAPAGQ